MRKLTPVEADQFALMLLSGAPLSDAVANMEVIEAVVRSTENGGWESLSE